MCILAFIVTSADIHVSQLWVYLYAILLIYCLRLSGCLQTCNVYRAGGGGHCIDKCIQTFMVTCANIR